MRHTIPFAASVLALIASAAGAQPNTPAKQTAKTVVTTTTPPIPDSAPVTPSPTVPSAPNPASTPTPPTPIIQHWSKADATALLGVIENIDADGLVIRDYLPTTLKAAIAAGEGAALDAAASKSFVWLAEDMRDGRTPVPNRLQWFALDTDQDSMPTAGLMAKALETHDVSGVIAGLAPVHPDYAALKAALASTPDTDKATRALIRANMDRWRWLSHDFGDIYLITNIPEYQLRLTVNDKIIRTYRTIVGKPGKTATPQLAEKVQAVVFNPTWTVPQSIVVGEGLGAKLLAHPSAQYKVTKAKNGLITVVQQPGKGNSLGVMKIDMPNPHAIYLHDTPNHALFNAVTRAFSHGCVRTERAQELGMTMAMLGANLTVDQAVTYANSGKYNRVLMTKTFPVYLIYMTMARDITGKLAKFDDLYDRDASVLASFTQPRQEKTAQRISNEAIIKLDNPL